MMADLKKEEESESPEVDSSESDQNSKDEHRESLEKSDQIMQDSEAIVDRYNKLKNSRYENEEESEEFPYNDYEQQESSDEDNLDQDLDKELNRELESN